MSDGLLAEIATGVCIGVAIMLVVFILWGLATWAIEVARWLG